MTGQKENIVPTSNLVLKPKNGINKVINLMNILSKKVAIIVCLILSIYYICNHYEMEEIKMKKIAGVITATMLLFTTVFPVSAEGTGGAEPGNEMNYTVITEGGNCEADIVSGSTSVLGDGAVQMNKAVLKLKRSIILPFNYGAEWSISFSGIMTPNGIGKGNLLADTKDSVGRFSLGVNHSNQIMFLGINIDGVFANYCWSVPVETMSGDHDYEISYSNGEFLLSIDGGEAFGMSSMNINQGNVTSTTSAQASHELVEKIKAIKGQEYIVMTHLGSTSHPCTAQLNTLSAKTSAIEGYQELTKHPLADLTIYYLGSSITYGSKTNGRSFVEITADVTGNNYEKETVSGTRLAISSKEGSYVERFANLPVNPAPDYLMIQLSSNDFSAGIDWGEISTSKELADLDSTTITGAIETLIAKAKKVWGDVTVVFYTCYIEEGWTKYDDYKTYVNTTMKELENKWEGDMVVLDLFNTDYIRNASYLHTDDFHPVEEGYAQLVVPEWINFLYELEHPTDKTELQQIVDEVEALEKNNYTEESWKKLEDALKTAQEVLDNEKATQAEVEVTLKVLKEARAALKVKDDSTVVNGDTTKVPDNKNVASPATGDGMGTTMVMATTMILLSFVSILFIFNKKRREN